MLKFSFARNTTGAASGGLILTVVLAAGIIAGIVYLITEIQPSDGEASASGGIPTSPLLGEVEMTRQLVDNMNRQRSAVGHVLGIDRTDDMNATNDLSWRASRDCGDIGTAIKLFQKDTKQWPIRGAADEDARIDYLFGNAGQLPQFSEKVRAPWGDSSDNLHSYLVSDGPEKKGWLDYFKNISGRFEGWNGPYLPHENPDPWGRAYLVSASGFQGGTNPDNNVWCLSAGPNGVVETAPSFRQTVGDDVGQIME
ncbi:hypothetical protein J7M28_03515 [bacterium]|nr:hypothetical protein [bacterium]